MQIPYKIVPIDSISVNERNPNSMKSRKFDALVKSIKDSGGNYKQPILVRATDIGYEIIDGEHRYKACKKIWLKSIVIREVSADDATSRMRTIGMNNIHGEIEPVEMISLITELRDKYGMSMEDIQHRTWFNKKEIQQYDVLESFSIWDVKVDPLLEVNEMEKAMGSIVTIDVTDKELEIIKKAFDMFPERSRWDIINLAAKYALKNATVADLSGSMEEIKDVILEDSIIEDFLSKM